ncbi:hypothetical protein [Alteribacillus sp. HJP-4]|uniref:hypothetical protein n=1 Tax=Alteribacillus sp. HJP-4 TaxID=2775394 RepID=UPI0035CD2E04
MVKWMGVGLQLEEVYLTDEVILLRTRFLILTDEISPEEAISIYENLGNGISYEKKLTFHGIKYLHRIDSYFDPYGYLSLKHRLKLEIAREHYKLKIPQKSAFLLYSN